MKVGHDLGDRAYRSLCADGPRIRAQAPDPADLCFITPVSVLDAMAQLQNRGIEMFEEPLARTGALGPIASIYFRDPDGHLIELSNYDPP